MEPTIEDVSKRMKVTLFSENQTDEVYKRYSIREKTLKNNIDRAMNSILEHVEKTENVKLNHWQTEKATRNVSNLSKYIEILFSKLNKESIIEYCDNSDKSLTDLTFDDDEFIFLVNSYYGNILLDIVWASDISVSDVINITHGKIDDKNLKRKLPKKVSEIKKNVLPFFKKIGINNELIDTINQSILCYNKKIHKGSGILLMVAIEGIVREFGERLMIKQEIKEAIQNKEYNSLDSFLRSIPWKEDIVITQDKFMFLTGNYTFTNLKQKEFLNENVSVNFKTRLDFLRRTFKEERNQVLHGEHIKNGQVWDLYRNFSALYEVYDTIKYYNENQ
ncbi:hypothetical protein [Saccharicrinis sp. GN24d3]|uniref:hypothetical protein n=1 Tax=Saccharicrinis sp. GN24d3 TaxID=3458416 RepID=UPI0040374ED0